VHIITQRGKSVLLDVLMLPLYLLMSISSMLRQLLLSNRIVNQSIFRETRILCLHPGCYRSIVLFVVVDTQSRKRHLKQRLLTCSIRFGVENVQPLTV
jgi:hypothetical protein